MFHIRPVEMTPEIMQMLEDKGCILRLTPNGHRFDLEPGAGRGIELYRSAEQYGPHKLISVMIDRDRFTAFGIHPDNEDFLLIGSNEDNPLLLLICLLDLDTFRTAAAAGTLKDSDFVCLKCKFNDPEVSFFTMLKNVPHGEAAIRAGGRPPKFYVTESASMGIQLIDLGEYAIL